MKTDKDPNQAAELERIEEHAAQWLLRCDRAEDTPAERTAFERWLAADTRHRAAYLKLENAWNRSEGLKAWKPHDNTVDVHVLSMHVTPGARAASAQPSVRIHQRSPSRIVWAMAACAAMIVLGVFIYFNAALFVGHTYATETGGYQRVPLNDGTTVQLNTDSKIEVRLTNLRREVRLQRGEAYFDIAHDPVRPFEVFAGGTVVRAIGTAFSVRLRAPGQVEVVVKEGRVAVVPVSAETPAALAAGETVVTQSAGRATVRKLDEPQLTRRLAWQTGQLAFQGEPLSAVVAEFNRYNHRPVHIADAELNSLEVAGNFKATDLESFIAAIRKALDVRVEERDDEVLLFAP